LYDRPSDELSERGTGIAVFRIGDEHRGSLVVGGERSHRGEMFGNAEVRSLIEGGETI
jgi:hypothetical protein